MLDCDYFEQNLISKCLHPESLSLKQSELNEVKSIPNTPDQNGARVKFASTFCKFKWIEPCAGSGY